VTKAVPLTIAGGLLVLTYLLLESRGPDQARQTRIHAAMQAMQLHDAELNRDVLLARAGLLRHYDSLASTGQELAHDLTLVSGEIHALGQPSAEAIGDDLDALAAALTRKLSLIEYVKSDNAVLRNSVAFFTQSLRNTSGHNQAPPTEVAALQQAMIRFIATPDAAVARDAERALARVRVADSRGALRPLVAHARVIVDLLPRLDTLLAEVADSRTAARMETV
jgi:DAHL domain